MNMSAEELRLLTAAYNEVEQCFAGLDDLAHGWDHVSRVYTIALNIAERENADQFIVGMAALMHDLGRLSSNKTRHHAELSSEAAARLMTNYGIATEVQQEILHAIIAHSFSKGIEPGTLEARVVRDADRLDSLGAIGILRWAITGTVRRTSSTRTYHPDDPFAEQHVPDDGTYMLDHFFTKLFKISDTMGTETGQLLAKRRTEFMRLYLNEFKRELEMDAG